jgi:hypothetical protein
MRDKKFVGRSKPGKYPDQVEIGLQQKDLDLLQESLTNGGTGWVNIRVNKGKDSGKPYAEIV